MTDGNRLLVFFDHLQADLQRVTSKAPHFDEARKRQLERARKRARITRPNLRSEAISRFISINEEVAKVSVRLTDDEKANAAYFITNVLERFTSTFSDDIQASLDPSFLLENWKFGPGSSNGVKGTHAADKIRQRFSCNSQSAPLVKNLRRSNPYLARFDYENGDDGLLLIRGSRLATVPKNEDTERTIAIEPSGQMALQLAAGIYLEGALRYIGLDITKQQPKNKAYALRGSIDGSLATIDMKSASDYISIQLARELLPPEWFTLLMTLRSQEIELPDGSWLKMNMISTMGNGFTFPLMTLIFVSLIYAYRCENGGPNLFMDWRDTCVFGDDVIVPTHEYHGVCDIFSRAGFIVNHDKSYSVGPFRESCGGDYYEGVDITPFYVTSLSSNPEIYVAINKVVSWGKRFNVILHETLLYLRGCIRGRPFLVPGWFNPDQGILSTQVARRFKYLSCAPPKKKLPPGCLFEMMLCCGGYIESSGACLFYTPRASKPRYVVRESRLPRGYLDGWDPIMGSHSLSDWVSTYLVVLFG